MSHREHADDPGADPIVAELEEFLGTYYGEEIARLAEQFPKDKRSLEIDWMDLWRHDTAVAEDFLEHPDEFRRKLETALAGVEHPVPEVNLSGAHVRVQLHKSDVHGITEVGSRDIGNYIGLEGQVTKITKKQPKPKQIEFECQRCGTATTVAQTGMELQTPPSCHGCDRDGPFQPLMESDDTRFVDHQTIRVKQPPEETKGGEGDYIDVYVKDDLVNVIEPGDRAEIMGKFSVELPDSGDIVGRKFLEGNAVSVKETDFDEINVDEHRDRIEALVRGAEGDPYQVLIDSLAPKIKIDEEIKEAIVLQLFGGVAVDYPDGSYDRGDSHILLLGDPGTAKSSLLRAVEELAPRSSYASGKGASAAGMTAAATPDDFGDGKWSLEAGALVLANNGVACVDEIDKIDDDARQSLHDAMESQRVNINKAGINATLPAETALLAAGNPKFGRFDPYEPIADQIELGPTLMSRFDLMFMLSDTPDEDRDAEISEHMVESRQAGIEYTKAESGTAPDNIRPTVDTDVFRAWVALARQEVKPEYRHEEVKQSIVDSITAFRQANSGDADAPVPVTMRTQEAIERLAEASARVRLSETVEMEDVDRAKRLIRKSLKQVGFDPEEGQFDADLVEADTSSSQRDRIKSLKSIISEMNSEYSGGIPIPEVLETAREEGLNPNKVENDIKKLAHEKGELVVNDDRIRPFF